MDMNKAVVVVINARLKETPLHVAHLADAIDIGLPTMEKILDVDSPSALTLSQFWTVAQTLKVQPSDIVREAEILMIKSSNFKFS